MVMTESYSAENQYEIDKIDLFVSENASTIALQIWSEDIPITNENILTKCLEYIQVKNFTTTLDLKSALFKAVFYGVIKKMTLEEDEYLYPEDYFNRTEY
jgi:hypothetical protein